MLVTLGASTGGPEALKVFFDALPNRSLPICFIVANHIDKNFIKHLQVMLNEHSSFEAEIIDGSKQLQAGKIFIVPVENQISFGRAGSIELLDEKWAEPYSPNINQLFLATLELTRLEKLAIIFSGMDDDGSQSAQALTDAGVEIWCQSEESCIQESMPKSMIKTAQVVYKDSPQGLAQQLVDLVDAIFPLDQTA